MNAPKQQVLPRLMYTVAEVAYAINLSDRQVRRLIQRGEIEAKRLGGVILVPTEELTRLLDDAPSAAAS